ncbi:hypothetical protein EDB84DRAFT_1569737 [Lactarius hengduanensis]|nr:hypothetical protein EDB84DRAFT_1569737 [Lactarius hengduanensis]
MRYLTVTGYPDNVEDKSSMLRQMHCTPPRSTEQFIVMTMYNEDDTLFARTMHGVMKNIAFVQARSRQDLGKGRLEGALSGPTRWSIVTNMVNGKPVSVHVCEYTTQIAAIEPIKIEDAERNLLK